MKKNTLLLTFFFILTLFACQSDTTIRTSSVNSNKESLAQNNAADSIKTIVSDPPLSESQKQIIAPIADTLIHWLAQKKIEPIANYVHPQKGLRFSPYSYVELVDDRVLMPADFEGLQADPKAYMWGFEDGIGDPIFLSFEHYYQRYIYNKDYAKEAQIAYNAILGQGNTINNRKKIYPQAIFVEYYISGTKQFGEMDWGSLTLVFEESKASQAWFLVGIIHGEWTI